MIDREQKMRFTKEELNLIKTTFSDNLEVLTILRKVMLQIELTPEEKVEQSKVFRSEGVMNVIGKCFLPQVEGDAPINQLVDLWLTLKIDDRTPEESKPYIEARGKLIEYIKQQLGTLSGIERAEYIDFNSFLPQFKDSYNDFVGLIVRNSMIAHTEQQLAQLLLLAGKKEETAEETMKRLQANSNK